MQKTRKLAKNQEKQKKVIKKLKNKFRLVVINNDTFEERFSLLLTPLNLFTVVGLVVILFSIALVSLIAFTPIREFIPGYSDLATKQIATYAAFKADSLEFELHQNKQYLENIRKILSGEPTNNYIEENQEEDANYDTITLRKSKQDSALRQLVENEEKFNVMPGFAREGGATNIGSLFLFPPMKGVLTSSFNPSIKHYGVDIAGEANEAVKSAYDGTVIVATWSSEDGYIIQIQHENDLISVYKHNSTLLKKTGDQVKAGDPIAIVGNSGENTTGPHLHFELWYKGNALDPQNYFNF